MKVLVTGSSGLIGSEAVRISTAAAACLRHRQQHARRLLRPEGDTPWTLRRLRRPPQFEHIDLDIRDRAGVSGLRRRPARPHHPLRRPAVARPGQTGRSTTSTSTPAARSTCWRRPAARPEAVFLLMSTNKVYGDAPNELPLVEQETR